MKNRLLDYPSGPHEAALETASPVAHGQAGGWRQRLEDFVADHPAVTLGTALSLGVLIGWLIKRRS